MQETLPSGVQSYFSSLLFKWGWEECRGKWLGGVNQCDGPGVAFLFHVSAFFQDSIITVSSVDPYTAVVKETFRSFYGKIVKIV